MKKIMLFVLVAACVCKTTGSFGQATNMQDSLALVALYDSTGGANWTNTWNLATPVSEWYGVSVTNGRVTSINLTTHSGVLGNNLSGSIPASLGNLSNLTYLELFGNQNLSGSIPATLGNLSNLTYLDLVGNQLSGSIPAALGNLSKLTVLDLGYNQLSGSIPSVLGNLSNLTSLGLYNNQLSDSIPSALSNLSKLIGLDLESNQLSGSIPSALGNLPNLGQLFLQVNQLGGSIPAALGNLSNLTELWLNNNQLSDSIPASIAHSSKLTELELQVNQFTFAGMEGIVRAYNFAMYSPQATIPLHYNGSELSVSAGGTLANDSFYWYKDNVLYKTIGGDSVLTITENGNYSVAVTNSIVTRLTDPYGNLILYSDTVTVTSLPVSLLSFTATKEGNKNLLQWATANEVNSSYFEVERSSDGVSFTSIGQVDAAGNSSVGKNYSLVDDKPVNGMNYYRLKMVDKDGEFTYSEVRTINEAVSFEVGIYPNPMQNSLNLNFSSDKAQTVQVVVVDNEGKVVATQQVEVAAGASTQGINVGGLSNGVYYVRVVTADGESELKFVKE